MMLRGEHPAGPENALHAQASGQDVMSQFYTGEGVRWLVAGEAEESNWVPDREGEVLMDRLLAARNIPVEERPGFLSPSLENMYDPFRLEGMQETAERIVCAIRQKHHLLLYGDYDVDGVASVAILKNFFSEIGFPISTYIPDRVDEGYGISDAAVRRIIDSPVQVLLTVDCGITAKRQVSEILHGREENGKPIDILITDHHQSSPDSLPDASALVNPHLPGSDYPFKALCGAGIAWKLVQAVSTLLGQPDLAMRWIDLAAFATIADIVELTGENRILVAHGLRKMNTNPHPGLAALHAVSGGKTGKIDTTRIGFLMAPRVNAAGRMGDAMLAVRLLTAKTLQAAEPISKRLDDANRLRQEVQETVFQQALETLEKRPDPNRDAMTVVWGEGWHHGVIGIVASKLVDRFHKPAFVLTLDDGEAVGSGRSIDGFDLFAALSSQSALLTRFGGHAQAGGLSLPGTQLEAFREGINRYATQHITPEMCMPTVEMEAELDASLLSVDTVDALQRLEPTGQGNRPPRFLIRDVGIVEVKTLSEGKHLWVGVEKAAFVFSCVGFGLGAWADHLIPGDRVDVSGWLERNEWQGRVSLQFRIYRMRAAEPFRGRNRFMLEAVRRFESLDCDGDWLYNGIILSGLSKDAFFPDREDLASVYRHFHLLPEKSFTPGELFLLARKLVGTSGAPLGFFRMMAGLMVFDELGLLSFTLAPDGTYRLGQPEEVEKVELEASELLGFLQEVAERVTARDVELHD